MRTYRFIQQMLLLNFGVLTLVSVTLAGNEDALKTVSQVDLKRYVGTWYEIARLPNRFQDQCVGNVTADYKRLDDGNIEVINRCQDDDSMIDEAQGVARIVDTSTNAKLEVSFVSLFGWNLFWEDYWILDLSNDYAYAVVGTPSRKYAWILARTRQISAKERRHIDQILTGPGYDPAKLIETRHTEPLQPN